MTLDQYTWDQAAIIRAWSPDAFTGIGIKPTTIRQWASRGYITAVGKGPNGCRLYLFTDVVRHAERSKTAVACPPKHQVSH